MVVKLEVFTKQDCPYCPKAVKAAEEAVEVLGDDVEYIKYDIAEHMDKVREYEIMSVPTMVVNGNIAFVEVPETKRLIAKLKRNMK